MKQNQRLLGRTCNIEIYKPKNLYACDKSARYRAKLLRNSKKTTTKECKPILPSIVKKSVNFKNTKRNIVLIQVKSGK